MARAFVLTVALAVGGGQLMAAAPDDAPLSGSRFERQLAAPVTAKWTNVSFRKALESLQQAQRIAIVIDRRIDADAPFALASAGDSLELTLARIAERKQVGCSVVESVVYFGPESICRPLQTVAALRREDIGKLPAGLRSRLSQSKPGGWPRLAQPAELVEQLADEARVTVENRAIIPHDLWAEARLPALPWSDRLTLVLAQFDLTFEIASDGRSIRLISIPDRITLTRKYAGGDAPLVRQAQLKKLVPDARIEVVGRQLIVRGRSEEHREIATLLDGKQVRTRKVTQGEQRYKLKVAGLPLENVFAQLGKLLKLDVRYERDAIHKADVSLQQLISFDVTDATLEELLTAALQDTGLTYTLTGTTVTIRPAR